MLLSSSAVQHRVSIVCSLRRSLMCVFLSELRGLNFAELEKKHKCLHCTIIGAIEPDELMRLLALLLMQLTCEDCDLSSCQNAPEWGGKMREMASDSLGWIFTNCAMYWVHKKILKHLPKYFVIFCYVTWHMFRTPSIRATADRVSWALGLAAKRLTSHAQLSQMRKRVVMRETTAEIIFTSVIFGSFVPREVLDGCMKWATTMHCASSKEVAVSIGGGEVGRFWHKKPFAPLSLSSAIELEVLLITLPNFRF